MKNQRMILIAAELLITLLVVFYQSYQTVIVFLGVQVMYAVSRIAPLIPDRLFNGADWLRRSCFMVPRVFAFYLFAESFRLANISPMLLLIIGIAGMGLLFPQRKELRLMFCKDFVEMMSPITTRKVTLETYSMLGAAITQELFYKPFIIALLYKQIGLSAILVAALLFTAEHTIHPMAFRIYTTRDHIKQFILASIGGILYVVSGSVVLPILLHLIYNIPIVMSFWTRWWLTKERVNRGIISKN